MKDKFRFWFATQNIRHFTADELIWYFYKHRAGVSNSFPPENLWPNIIPTLRVLDKLRDYFDRPISISSTYRSPQYNAAIGGASKSFHCKFNAIDFTVQKVTPNAAAAILKEFRKKGDFKGGIGIYPSFVHVDTRGYNATW